MYVFFGRRVQLRGRSQDNRKGLRSFRGDAHEAVASDDHVPAFEEHTPLLVVTNVTLVAIQAGLLFLLREAGEAGASGIATGHEEFLAVEKRGIRSVTVVAALQGEPPKVGDEGLGEHRVADTIEVRIHEVRDSRLAASELH